MYSSLNNMNEYVAVRSPPRYSVSERNTLPQTEVDEQENVERTMMFLRKHMKDRNRSLTPGADTVGNSRTSLNTLTPQHSDDRHSIEQQQQQQQQPRPIWDHQSLKTSHENVEDVLPPSYLDSAIIRSKSITSSVSTSYTTKDSITTDSFGRNTSSIPSLSCVIPYAVPTSRGSNERNNNNDNLIKTFSERRPSMATTESSWGDVLSTSMPNNCAAIECSVYSSPHVDSVEPRFIISKNKFQDYPALFLSSDDEEDNNIVEEKKEGSATRDRTKSFSSQLSTLFSFSNKNTTSPNNKIPRRKRTQSHIGSSNGSSSANARRRSSVYLTDNSVESSTKFSTSLKRFLPNYNKIDEFHVPFKQRYNEIGTLGSGASGSVKLVESKNHATEIFAIKEFRKRDKNKETKRDYIRTITSEYCVGVNLTHPNIIKTMELHYEDDFICQVMEYCAFDLFAITMSDLPKYEEICCYFKQLLDGVEYLHSIGLAHRDLKLENCVIDNNGILKLIDFGCSVVFQYPCSKTLIEASGVVGSDPYLAPEVLLFTNYDPRPVDIWSCAIIFICMIIKKFPWGIPNLQDDSFKKFCYGRDSVSLNDLLTREPSPEHELNLVEVDVDDNDSDDDYFNYGNGTRGNAIHTHEDDIHVGPLRILHALPEETQPIINKMLNLAPACRANIVEILNDPWVQSIDMCHILGEASDGSEIRVVNNEGHEHSKVEHSKAHISGFMD